MSGYPERTNPMTTSDPTPTDIDVERVLADGRPAIRCGCGLVVVSDDQETNLEVFAAHDCPLTFVETTSEDVDHWYHHVFSLWGWVILGTIAYAIVLIFGHGK